MKSLLCLSLCCFVFVPLAAAQSDRSRVSGTIYDSSGAVIPNAQVTATSRSTAASRVVVADAKGHYAIDELLPAAYEVIATAPGFAGSNATDVILAVGQERALSFHLQPEGVTETIAVTADAVQIDTRSAHIGATVSAREVDNLPLNGRQVAQLYLLVPGATASGTGTFDDMRFAGRSSEQNVIRYDGIEAGSIIDANPGDVNGAGAGAVQFRLSQSLENIQEFRVESSNYSAENGRGTGGQVTIITRSGSNDFHGALFENVRNDRFDKRNYFDTGVEPAPLSLNQFGGSAGGPLARNRLFFFASNENLIQRVSVPFSQSTLSDVARASAVPAIRPLLAAFPVASTATSSPLFSLANGNLPSEVHEHFVNLRIDVRPNDRNTMYFRYSHDQGDSTIPKDLSGSANVVTTVPQNAIADWTTILSAATVNDFKIGFNALKSANTTAGVNLAGLDLSNVTINIGGAAQSGSTGNITPTGAGSTPLVHAMTYDNHALEIIDHLSWNRGAHSFKTGFEINRRVINMDQLGGIVYTFSTVQTFLANQPSQVQLSSDLGSSPSPFHNGVTGIRQGLQTFYGLFIQDEWRARSNLTLNYGLRYDYFQPMHEAHDYGVNVDTNTGQLLASGEPFYASKKTNVGPRLALTWAPEALHGNTVFRAGAGLYYGAGQGEDQTQPIANDFVVQTLTTGSIGYPLNRAQLVTQWNPNDPAAGYQPRVFGADYALPERVGSYTFSWQQALPAKSILTVAYVGSKASNLFQRTIANLMTGVTTSPTTGVGVIQRQFGDRYAELDVKTSGGWADYNSLQIGWNRRLSEGLTAVANYTLAHSYGTSGGSNEAITSENNYNFSSEVGDTIYDIRHTVNLAAVWTIPHHATGGGALDAAIGGWQLGGSFNARSGLPVNLNINRPNILYRDNRTGLYYTAPVLVGGVPVTTAVVNVPGGGQSRGTQRPDLVPGVDPYLHDGSLFWLNPAAFAVPLPGTYGNLERSSLRGPNFFQFDMSLSRRFAMTSKTGLELRVDAYNLFNRTNFANPSGLTLNSATPASPTTSGLQPGQIYTTATAGSSFGRLASTVGQYVGMGTARQIQFALRFRF
jgi:carboxypeptidase family protein